MQKSRCVGLVGGLGVGAGVHYYKTLARRCEDRGYTLDIVITNADTPRVFSYVAAKNPVALAEYLNGYLRRMIAAGAEIAVIPAVTPHYAGEELAAMSSVPLVSIFDPLREGLRSRHYRRVAVFGTRFVIESDMFGALADVEIVRPHADEIEVIHATYVGVAASAKGSAEQHDKLAEIARTLVKRDGVDAIVFAGTDLSLLFDQSNTDFPHVDCAALHIEEILKQIA